MTSAHRLTAPPSSRSHSAALTKTALLGCVAIRANRRLDYDAAADQFLNTQYRAGFGV